MINLEKGHIAQICLDAQACGRVSFALQQNGFPIIRAVSVHNSGIFTLADSTLEISAAPQFMQPLALQLAEVGPSESETILIDNIEPGLD